MTPTRQDYERAAHKIGELCPFAGKHTCPYCVAASLLSAAAERMTPKRETFTELLKRHKREANEWEPPKEAP